MILYKILFSTLCIVSINCFVSGQANTQNENVSEQLKAINTQLDKRVELIKSCMNIFSTPIDMTSGDEQKISEAYNEQKKALMALGELRAVEAAPLLAKMIFYRIPGDESPNIAFVNRMFGCVPTLVKIGKPGAVECLKRIVNFTEEDWQNEMDPTLLVLVILRVEGERTTRQIFDDFKTSLKNEHQIKNMEKAIILIDAARDLDGVVQDAYSKLKQELIKAEK